MKIDISVARQQLALLDDAGHLLAAYPVSTAAKGVGEQSGSNQTPRGLHYIRARIGEGCPCNTVFVRRRPTGEIFTPELSARYPGRDWILTRILWLCGLEPGFNRGGRVDTMRRYIYIHGTPDLAQIGQPASHGCIRMANDDLLALFARVPAYTPVLIREE